MAFPGTWGGISFGVHPVVGGEPPYNPGRGLDIGRECEPVPDMAQAGGKDPAKLGEAIEAGVAVMLQALT